MYSRSVTRWVAGGFSVHRDTTKTPRLMKEVGQWLYQESTTVAFRKWCNEQGVRAYGGFRMTSTPQFARCLRASRSIQPGEAVVTCPSKSCFNFLTVAQEQQSEDSSGFPLPLNWMNYADRLSFLKSTSMAELATAGWMVRIASLESSPFTPYIHFLLEDTRGRDGIAHGLSKEREEDSGLVDHYFSELATDAGEDPEVFLENLFRSFACLFLRTQPIESEAIASYLTGTDFFKAKASSMYVPTLIPMVDCVPQVEDDTQNTVLQYFPYPTTGVSEWWSGLRNELLIAKENAVDISHFPVGSGGGLFVLRAIRLIEEGDVLYLRHYPPEGDAAQANMNANVIEANRLLSHDN